MMGGETAQNVYSIDNNEEYYNAARSQEHQTVIFLMGLLYIYQVSLKHGLLLEVTFRYAQLQHLKSKRRQS